MAKLFLIPTTLNPEINSAALISAQLEQIRHLQHFIVETAKTGRAHLKQLNLVCPLQQLDIQELNKHQQDLAQLISPLIAGYDIGLISDCGTPAIADPGNVVVAKAHELGIEVIPLIGPNSLILTLMASGLNGQKFSFHGYLPIDAELRTAFIQALNKKLSQDNCSNIFIETPFRNQKLFEALITNLDSSVKLCLGINLMTDQQQILTKSIDKWRKNPPSIDKQQVIFIVGK